MHILTIVQRVALLLIMCLAPLLANAQDLQGVVMDSDKNPLIAVALQVNDGQTGTTTDVNGKYSFSGLKSGDKIVAFYIGMLPQTIIYSGEKTLNIVMENDSQTIEDVVVVGFGSQKKETVVGSVTSASSEDIMRAGNVTTISEALTGIMPGVSTMQATGQPGSTEATILIRGQSTWGDNTPLYMVDGVERDFNSLDPNEIESITVLKDASATAVYGVKAANGVILVTTKTGQESAPRINFSGTFSLKSPTVDTDYIADYPETLRAYNQAAMNDDQYGTLFTDRFIAMWEDPDRNMEKYTYTRWANEIFKTGISQAYNINISGGSERVKYFTSVGYNYDGDIIDVSEQETFDPRTYQKRYNWRSNIDFQVTKSTKLSVKVAGDVTDLNCNSETSGSGVGSGSEALSRMYSVVMIGTAPVLNNGYYGMEETEISNSKNILALYEAKGSVKKRSNKLYTDVILEQTLTPKLKLGGKFSYNKYDQYSYSYSITHVPYMYPADEDGNYSLVDATTEPDVTTITSESISSYNNSYYYEGSLRYNNTFNSVHDVSAVALVTRRVYQSGVGWPYKEESWIGRATYGYDKKYLFEFNGAYNGSEKFAPGNRFGFFPSAAIGWVASEEDFFKEKLSAIDFLKIRYSYGIVGSDTNTTRFAYTSVYSQLWPVVYYGSSGNGTTVGGTYYEGTPANEDATWEESVKQNIGIELTFLDSRLGLTLDLFDEQRTGIYMSSNTIPTWYGGSTPSSNMGETKNHGFDVELTWNDRVGKDFSYWAKANISISENRVVFRDDAPGKAEYQRAAGKPIGYSSGLLHTGLYQSWQDVYLYTESSYNPNDVMPGDLTYIDYNSDGIIDADDAVVYEDVSYATKSFAFNFGATYKRWSISAMFNGMFGLSKYQSSTDLWTYESMSSIGFVLKNNHQKTSWTPTNTTSTDPINHLSRINHNWQTSTYTTVPADFLRLRNMEIKYRVGDIANAIKNMEVYVSGQNLLTWSKLPAIYDPEASSLLVYPISKKYSLGVKCSF